MRLLGGGDDYPGCQSLKQIKEEREPFIFLPIFFEALVPRVGDDTPLIELG